MEEIKANKTETYHENESFKKLIINLLRKTIVSVKQEQDPFLKEYSEKNSWKLIYTYGKLKKKFRNSIVKIQYLNNKTSRKREQRKWKEGKY